MLTAEIIAIGSELLAPDRSDTNSLWLTEKAQQHRHRSKTKDHSR